MILNLGGTIRSCTAADTLKRVKPLLPIFGITRVASQEGLSDMKVPVSFAYRPNGRCLSASQGKGMTRELADVSAIMEAIELFHAERLPPATVNASVSALRSSQIRFISPDRLEPSKLSSLFSEEESIGWLSFTNLIDGQSVLVPREFINMDRIAKRTEISTLGLSPSGNGLASGNTSEEAILHGVYELIERQAIYEYNFSPEPADGSHRYLDLHSVSEIPLVAGLLHELEKADVSLTVKAIHGSLNIPVFEAAIEENSVLSRGNFEFKGHGSHYSAEIALVRAITEAIQSRVTIITAARDDIYPWLYRFQDLVSVPREKIAPTLKWNQVPPSMSFESHQQALQWTLEKLSAHGFKDICYFNHQREEYGNIPVVHVVCPGLRSVPIDDQ